MTHEQQVAYWKVNLRYIIWILAIWFSVSTWRIIFADALDAIGKNRLAPIGFWFANQGSLVVFVVLIFWYVGG